MRREAEVTHEPLVVTSIKLEPDTVAALDAIARTERRTRGFLIRDAVALFLAVRERQATA